MQCEVVGCTNEADSRLVHKYSGKVFCLSCSRQINKWNPKEDVVPIPEGIAEQAAAVRPARRLPTGSFVKRPEKLD